MKRILFDIETDGLFDTMTQVHVIILRDIDTGEELVFDPSSSSKGEVSDALMAAERLYGHNIIGFDLPALAKLWGLIPPGHTVDTLTWSRVVFPDLGKYSLEAWGDRLGCDKLPQPEDWSEWTKTMTTYCRRDVEVNIKLLDLLRTKYVPTETLDLEMEVHRIVTRQHFHGFKFDEKRAQELYTELIAKRETIKEECRTVFPSWEVDNGKPFIPKRDNKRLGYTKGVSVQKKKMVEFNPGSRQHISYWLQKKYDWKPVDFTPTMLPKVSDEVLEKLDYPEAQKLAEFLRLTKIVGYLGDGKGAWLQCVDTDGRVHGSVNTCGTPTARMTHFGPNMSQVPSSNKPYGTECRALFTVPDDRLLVGIDASGLELRCLAHYMAKYDDGEYGKHILDGDIHTINQKAAGLPTRDQAKTFIYAFLYGAGAGKIGSIVKGSNLRGAELKRKFLKEVPALAALLRDVRKASKKGYLTGLDGRYLKVRSQHSALNTLLQGAGAIIMKKGLVLQDQHLQESNLVPGVHYEYVNNVHDEFQVEVKNESMLCDGVGQSGVQAIRDAGTYYEMRIPLDAEYKVGSNWSETH